jgi:hypothetical protein
MANSKALDVFVNQYLERHSTKFNDAGEELDRYDALYEVVVGEKSKLNPTLIAELKKIFPQNVDDAIKDQELTIALENLYSKIDDSLREAVEELFDLRFSKKRFDTIESEKDALVSLDSDIAKLLAFMKKEGINKLTDAERKSLTSTKPETYLAGLILYRNDTELRDAINKTNAVCLKYSDLDLIKGAILDRLKGKEPSVATFIAEFEQKRKGAISITGSPEYDIASGIVFGQESSPINATDAGKKSDGIVLTPDVLSTPINLEETPKKEEVATSNKEKTATSNVVSTTGEKEKEKTATSNVVNVTGEKEKTSESAPFAFTGEKEKTSTINDNLGKGGEGGIVFTEQDIAGTNVLNKNITIEQSDRLDRFIETSERYSKLTKEEKETLKVQLGNLPKEQLNMLISGLSPKTGGAGLGESKAANYMFSELQKLQDLFKKTGIVKQPAPTGTTDQSQVQVDAGTIAANQLSGGTTGADSYSSAAPINDATAALTGLSNSTSTQVSTNTQNLFSSLLNNQFFQGSGDVQAVLNRVFNMGGMIPGLNQAAAVTSAADAGIQLVRGGVQSSISNVLPDADITASRVKTDASSIGAYNAYYPPTVVNNNVVPQQPVESGQNIVSAESKSEKIGSNEKTQIIQNPVDFRDVIYELRGIKKLLIETTTG